MVATTLLAIATVVLSMVVTYLTLWLAREARATRRVAALSLLNAELGADQLRELRGQLFRGTSLDPQTLSDEHLDGARRLAVAYDRVGQLVLVGAIDRDAFEITHGFLFARAT